MNSLGTLRRYYTGSLPCGTLLSTDGHLLKQMNNRTIRWSTDEPQIVASCEPRFPVTATSHGGTGRPKPIECVIRGRPILISLGSEHAGYERAEACQKRFACRTKGDHHGTGPQHRKRQSRRLDAGAERLRRKTVCHRRTVGAFAPRLRRFTRRSPLPKVELRKLSIDLERRIVELVGQIVTDSQEFRRPPHYRRSTREADYA